MNPTDEVRERVRRRNAADVARYYLAHLNLMGVKPTYSVIASRFGRKLWWVAYYLECARSLGFIDEWD